MALDLIYTINQTIVAKQHRDWKVWQKTFKDFEASLSFQNEQELSAFLISEYGLDETAGDQIDAILQNSSAGFFLLELPQEKDGQVNLKELHHGAKERNH